MKLILPKHNLRAVSLAEVLVVLAIAAVTLISISQLTVKLLVTIKNDEIIEYTTAISLQTLEIAKNADDIYLSAATPIANIDGQYKIDFNSSPASLYRVSPSNGVSISNCTESSTYFIDVDVPNIGLQPLVCMQILIESSSDTLNNDYYLLRAVTVTVLGQEKQITEFQGYRRGAFNIQGSPGTGTPTTPPPTTGSQYEQCYPYGTATKLCCTYVGGQVDKCETRPA